MGWSRRKARGSAWVHVETVAESGGMVEDKG